MDSTEKALLLAIAANLKQTAPIQAYSDWLQEQGNPGWLIVENYPVLDWAVWVNYENERVRKNKTRKISRIVLGRYTTAVPNYDNRWKLPWLEGEVRFPKWVEQPTSRTKQILTAYAEGRVVN